MHVAITVNGASGKPTSSRACCSWTSSATTSASPARRSPATRRSAAPAPSSLDGAAVKSCTVLAVQADGADGRRRSRASPSNGTLHAVQEAFCEQHGLQCGFCTPGMIMTSVDLLERNPNPSDDEIRHALEGNLCRCTGYENIVRAVREAAEVAG